jgi:hypothetical protein
VADGADMWILTSTVGRFLRRVEIFFGNQARSVMGMLWSNYALPRNKWGIHDPAGLVSVPGGGPCQAQVRYSIGDAM